MCHGSGDCFGPVRISCAICSGQSVISIINERRDDMAPPKVKDDNLKPNSNRKTTKNPKPPEHPDQPANDNKPQDADQRPTVQQEDTASGKPKAMFSSPQDGKIYPAFNVFAVVRDGRNRNRIGAQIGRIFNHKSGAGLSIYLDSQPIPVDGRVHLTAFPFEPRS